MRKVRESWNDGDGDVMGWDGMLGFDEQASSATKGSESGSGSMGVWSFTSEPVSLRRPAGPTAPRLWFDAAWRCLSE